MVAILGARGYLGSVVARRWAELGRTGDYVINCLRPDDLARVPDAIVPSTDAIDEDSEYAATKRQVEAAGRVVIRAGIVDLRHDYPGAYTNWFCNPLTPLEWADLAWELRDSPGVHMAGRETVTRFDIARLVSALWHRTPPIPVEAETPNGRVQPVDRWRPPLREALIEYREWLSQS